MPETDLKMKKTDFFSRAELDGTEYNIMEIIE